MTPCSKHKWLFLREYNTCTVCAIEARDKAVADLRNYMAHHSHINTILEDAGEAGRLLNDYENESDWFKYDDTLKDAVKKLLGKIRELQGKV